MNFRIPTLAVLLAVAATSLAASAPAKAATTKVSIEFDDGRPEVYTIARPLLNARNIKATIYVNTGSLGTSEAMTVGQVDQLDRDGHEIGGHTRNHKRLSTLTSRQQAKEICDDRKALLARGYEARTMALPFGDFDSRSQTIAAYCGYNSVRGVGLLSDSTPAESIPPANPFLTRTPGSVMTDTTQAEMRAMVTKAENAGGGWVQMTFHRICENRCDDYAVTKANLTSFLDWVKARSGRGTVIERATDVLGGPTQPLGSPSRRALTNASLERDDDDNRVPDCWEVTGYGDNDGTASLSTDALSGTTAHKLDVSRWVSGDRKLITRRDTTCAPSITAGRIYTMSGWTKGTAPSALVAFYRDRGGDWKYWGLTPTRPGTATWSPVSLDLTAPAGATAVSFGFAAMGKGTLLADAFDLEDVQQPFPSAVPNGSLEDDADGDGKPDCFELAGYGTSSWTDIRTTDAFAGSYAHRLDVHSITSGDRKVLIDRGGDCTPDVEPGKSYSLSTQYKSTVPVRFSVYYLDASGDWQVLSGADIFPAASSWTQAQITTPPMPSGAQAMTWGLAIDKPGSVLTDAYYAGDLP